MTSTAAVGTGISRLNLTIDEETPCSHKPHMRVVAGALRRPVPPQGGGWPEAGSPSGDRRIATAFATAGRRGRRAALMPFLMGGLPTLAASRKIGEACVAGGADILELGIPCANPHADGPVIREAGAAALRAGATLDGILDVARALSRRVPVVIMCYAETVLARGARPFAAALDEAGVSGLVVPDLAPRDLVAVQRACLTRGIALVPLVAPATPDDHIAHIGGRGFVYAMSVSGTTGERSALPLDLPALISRARAGGCMPVALGFGISRPEHAANAADAGADGVIVGSRLVRAAAESADPPAAVGELVAGFSRALARRAAPADPALAVAA